ncbi:hypothetical protein NKH59_30735 [Mesorhizobium sp. M0998]
MSYFGLIRVCANPVSASRNGAHQQAWALPCPGHANRGRLGGGKAPGPLRAFFLRIRNKRGHQIAAAAVPRKIMILIWHMLTKEQDYF